MSEALLPEPEPRMPENLNQLEREIWDCAKRQERASRESPRADTHVKVFDALLDLSHARAQLDIDLSSETNDDEKVRRSNILELTNAVRILVAMREADSRAYHIQVLKTLSRIEGIVTMAPPMPLNAPTQSEIVHMPRGLGELGQNLWLLAETYDTTHPGISTARSTKSIHAALTKVAAGSTVRAMMHKVTSNTQSTEFSQGNAIEQWFEVFDAMFRTDRGWFHDGLILTLAEAGRLAKKILAGTKRSKPF